jgi:thioredoxin 1
MLRSVSRILTTCLVLALASPAVRALEPPTASTPASTPPTVMYDELADANRDLAAALETAKADRKMVLVVYGANWCQDCKDFEVDLNAASLGSLIAEHYVLVKVDIGKPGTKKNADVALRYGVPIGRGIPAVAVVLADGKKLLTMDGRQMADLRAKGRPAVVKFFDPGASTQ